MSVNPDRCIARTTRGHRCWQGGAPGVYPKMCAMHRALRGFVSLWTPRRARDLGTSVVGLAFMRSDGLACNCQNASRYGWVGNQRSGR